MQTSTPQHLADAWAKLREGAAQVLVGMDEVFQQLTIALFSGGHVLLEGVPGTGKTLAARTLAGLVGCTFKRVQFTPDLMPSDILGTSVFDIATRDFHIRKGPIFAGIVLADEINRAPAKTQAALLEAMDERQVTIEGETFPLPEPFVVTATQNPLEYEGTYPLPEAQLDRFQFKIIVEYRAEADEVEVLRRHGRSLRPHQQAERLIPVLGAPEVVRMQAQAQEVRVEEGILAYLTAIARASRRSPDLALGASPRASLAVLRGARVLALMEGRDYVLPDDIKRLVPPAFRHRVLLRPEAEIQGVTADDAVGRVLATVEVPR